MHPEGQYLELMSNICKTGFKETGRNGNTISVFGASMRFSLQTEEKNHFMDVEVERRKNKGTISL